MLKWLHADVVQWLELLTSNQKMRVRFPSSAPFFMNPTPVTILDQKKTVFKKQQNFLFRLFFETSFILTIGFVATLVLQTLWMIGRMGSTFSYTQTRNLFETAMFSCFAISAGCFVIYFMCFYFFAVFHRLAWRLVRKSFITLFATAFFNLVLASLSLFKLSLPFLTTISQARMFLYFFPPMVLSAFIGISVSTTFIIQMRQVQLKKAELLNLSQPNNSE